METDPEPVHEGRKANTRDAPSPMTGPIETEEPSADGQARLPSQPSTPRSRPRNTASTHPSEMWFCPMPRSALREGASPTGWSCLQSLVSHLRSVHLSTGTDAWLDTHGLRVGLACREITPTRGAVPGTTLLHGGTGGTGPGKHGPPGAGTLTTGRASPSRPGPGAPTGNPDSHSA